MISLRNGKTPVKAGLKMGALVFAVALLVGAALIFVLERMEISNARKHAQLALEAEADNLCYRIESALGRASSLEAYLDGAGGDMSEFDHVAASILQDPMVRAISIAPDGKVAYYYPEQEAQSIVGRDLLAPDRLDQSARRAIEREELTLAGPVDLIDGDRVLAARVPVYQWDEQGRRNLWGLVSLLLKFPDALQSDRMDALETDGYAYQLSASEDGSVLLGSKRPLPDDALTKEINLHNARWTLRLGPADGWVNWRVHALSLGLLLLFCLVLAVLAYLIVKRRVGELYDPAACDELTGLLTREYGERLIRRIMASGYYAFAALVLLDVDGFTHLNDALGKPAGDRVLKSACDRLKGCLRGQDVLCRVVGDTIMVCIFYNHEDAFLPGRVEMLRQAFTREVRGPGGEVFAMHASAGAAKMPAKTGDFQALYERADLALFWAKRDGKDRAAFYQETPPDQAVELP